MYKLPTQALFTKDGKSISMGVVAHYRISDALKAFTKYDDLDNYLTPLIMSSAQESVLNNNVSDIEKIQHETKKALKQKLRNSGIEILDIFVNELSPCRVIRLVNAN